MPVFAATRGEADQPDAAHRRQGQHRGMLPLAGAQHVPGAAEPLPGPGPLGEQPVGGGGTASAASVRAGAHRRAQQGPGAATPNPLHRTPNTTATSRQPRADVGDQPVQRGQG